MKICNRKEPFIAQNDSLWIGMIGDGDIVQDLNEKGCNVSTAFNVQRKFLGGLEEWGVKCDTISAYPSPHNWKKWKYTCYKGKNRSADVRDVVVSFPNFPMIDRFVKLQKVTCLAKQWIEGKEKATVFTYSLSSTFLMAAVRAKKKNPNCRFISIVPDLPEYMSNSQNKVYRFLKKIDRYVIDYCLKYADGFVLFSERMRERLNVKDKPYVVVEGILNVDSDRYLAQVENRQKADKKVIMLSGNLDVEEGVPKLLEIFSDLEGDEYELWLTGEGNSESEIKAYQKNDARVKYYGYIASYENFIDLQNQASVFVLMVSPEHPKAPYYFPSKIMEYLATGGEVACFHLPCIPKEYDEYLIYLPEDSRLAANTLKELCNYSADTKIENAKRRLIFLEQKSQKNQTGKIVDLLETIEKMRE